MASQSKFQRNVFFFIVKSPAATLGVVVLMINVGENIETVTDFIQSNNYTFPVLLDSDYDVAGKYRIQYTPVTFFIDKEGRLRTTVVGAFQNQAAIERKFANLLD